VSIEGTRPEDKDLNQQTALPSGGGSISKVNGGEAIDRLPTGNPKPVLKNAVSTGHKEATGIAAYARLAEEVMSESGETIVGAIHSYARDRAYTVVQAIASAPEVFHEEVEKGVAAIEIDRDSFRRRAGEIKASLFSVLP